MAGRIQKLFFANKTSRTLEVLKALALRVLFMWGKNKQNREMNKTVLFIISRTRIKRRKDGFVHFVTGLSGVEAVRE